jgi:hypothetical protein
MDTSQISPNGEGVRPLNKLCIYDRGEWVDVLRIYEVPCNGMLRYVLHHIEDEDMYIFDGIRDVLEAAGRRVALEAPSVGPCPPGERPWF